MNQEQQIKALAESDGGTQNPVTGWWFNADDTNGGDPYPPDYLTSYDAIIPLIQKQELGTRLRFYGNCLVLTRAYGLTDSPLELKPAQLAEALLRATNRWIEESNELPCKHEYQEDSTVCTKCGA